MSVQVSDAQPAALRGQGLDPGLPSAPLQHLPVRQHPAEAGVGTAGYQPVDPQPVSKQPGPFQCRYSLQDAAAGCGVVCMPHLVL